jgi:hypothetical protein
MSPSSLARTRPPPPSVLLFRAAVVFPALLAALLLALRPLAMPAGGTADAGSLELQPAAADDVREIDVAPFGPALAAVTSAAAAAELDDGWVVLDSRSQQLVFLNREGELRRVVGRPGEGPGELRRAAHLGTLGSVIAVLSRRGESLDLFEVDGSFRGRTPLAVPGCLAAPVEKLVSDGQHIVLVRRCAGAGGSMAARIERLDEQGVLERLAERAYGNVLTGPLNPMEAPALSSVRGQVHFGVVPSRCVERLSAAPGEPGNVCFPDVERPHLPEALTSGFREMEGRAKEAGVRVDLPERYPPFVDLVEVGGRLGFVVLLEQDRVAVDVLDGDRLRRIVLAPGIRAFFGPSSMLLARDDLEGTAFAVRPLP